MHQRKEEKMEGKKNGKSEKQQRAGIRQAENLLKALLCAFLVTVIFLLFLSLLLYKAALSEQNVNLGIIVIYVIGTFSGGFVMGKLEGQKKFVWGMLSGVGYFLLLLLVSLGMYQEITPETGNLFLTLVLCISGGMLGGMVA